MKHRISGIYLCLFSDGTLKVGRGGCTKSRLANHRTAGACFGIDVVKTDSINCFDEKAAEKMLLEWCGSNSISVACREWFKGVDYDACLLHAKEIAASLMGPRVLSPLAANTNDILARFVNVTREAAAYQKGRADMVRVGIVPLPAIQALDALHQMCEQLRRGLAVGATAPEWYETLNILGPWEEEVFLADGTPCSELFRAAADALEEMK